MQTLKCNQWTAERFTKPGNSIAGPEKALPRNGELALEERVESLCCGEKLTATNKEGVELGVTSLFFPNLLIRLVTPLRIPRHEVKERVKRLEYDRQSHNSKSPLFPSF